VQVVATGLLFRRGLLVKSGDALERLAEADVAVFDKTGTLTSGAAEFVADVHLSGADIARAATLARASRHPLSQALSRAAGDGPVRFGAQEIPGAGIEAPNDGGAVLRLGRWDWVRELYSGEAGNALCRRVVPSQRGESELWFGDGRTPPLRFVFADCLRPDTKTMLCALARNGISAEMLSGDGQSAAARIATEAGLSKWAAQVDPIAKTRHLKALRTDGHNVLFVGDGLNDAASLALAHVSISPGTAVDAARAASDMVLQGASLWPVAQAIAVARAARRRVLENFAFAALYNLVAVPLAALGLVTPLIAAVAMASSSLIVMLNALRQSVPEKA
jgi:Cu2+-exporting ATPase